MERLFASVIVLNTFYIIAPSSVEEGAILLQILVDFI